MQPYSPRLLTALSLSLALTACGADGNSSDGAADTQGSGGTQSSDNTASTSGSSGSDTASTIDYAGESNLGACGTNADDPARYATVGFWKTSDCSGDPVATNAFPINDTAGCYCWSGSSGENSADSFSCDAAAETVSIVQYNSLTCGADDNTPTPKTFYLGRCEQDTPATLYSRVLDMGPCTP